MDGFKPRTAASLHLEYRAAAEETARVYSDLRTRLPGQYPKAARALWRVGMLAEVWGVIATRLSGGKVDYLANWREGR